IDPHGLEVARGIDQSLPLLHAGAGRGDIDRIGGEPLLGELEGHSRPGRGLEEEVDNGLASQYRDLLDGPFADLLEGLGGVEDSGNLVGIQVLEPDQVLPKSRRAVHQASGAGTSWTASWPSISGTRTSTAWPGRTSTSLP